MRSCPSCGAPAKPADKFCGQCGTPLGTYADTNGNEKPSHPPVFSKTILFVILAISIIIAIAAGAFFLKNSGNSMGDQIVANHTPASFVIIETEVPLPSVPTTPSTTATPSPTTILTTVTTPKYGICPTDRRLCGTNCTDT
ncbi:zinc ribbon domain-containing protein, partial [Methanoregula sp.]|uniref:zinc ribbon domain-containing protein n=1 Tax=Methanoregula sp. TaxID=2052170 RepID=UPI000CC35B2B